MNRQDPYRINLFGEKSPPLVEEDINFLQELRPSDAVIVGREKKKMIFITKSPTRAMLCRAIILI